MLILLGLLRTIQALVIKVLPIGLAGVAVASYWPNQNALAFVCLAWAWWNLGSRFYGVRGVRWRSLLSTFFFCAVMFVSAYLFIDLWQLSWAGLWILLLTSAVMGATHEKKPQADQVNTPDHSQSKNLSSPVTAGRTKSRTNSPTTTTAITSSFMGLIRRASCPGCGAPVAVNLGFTTLMLCPNCGDYLEVVEKELRQMDPTLIRSTPAFAAPTPWMDMHAPRFGTISFFQWDDFVTDQAESILTDRAGVRVLDAKWPAICCVCGKPPTRGETSAQQFIFTPPGLIRVRSRDATIVAKGIPHCAEHEHGAVFERAMFSTPGQETVVGLFFRSYAYQIQFRKLNPWKWADELQ